MAVKGADSEVYPGDGHWAHTRIGVVGRLLGG